MTEYTFVNEINELKSVVSEAKLIVTDRNVKKLYGDITDGAYVLPVGETAKSTGVLFDIIKAMHDSGMTRSDTLCAVGGGVVGDVAGLAAALYMRGIKLVSVPTTLLAIVDSSIGGKTAVDFDGVKNLVGAFKEPNRIVTCFKFIDTLDCRERLCGVGEIVKTCMLTSSAFDRLFEFSDDLKSFIDGEGYDARALKELADICIATKREIVERDPLEHGLRAILNVGHTVGHALESVNNYDKSHGEYVMSGMLAELAMLKEFVDAEFYARVTGLLTTFVRPPKSTANGVLKAASGDKKNSSDDICVMLPTKPGDIAEIRMARDEFKLRYESAIKELKQCTA